MENINLHIEALIFASEQSISVTEILAVLDSVEKDGITREQLKKTLEDIRVKYTSDEYAFELREINNGFSFLTKKAYYPTLNQLQLQRSKKRLSQAALETLAIIAYRQPITKLEIEQIRTVSCDYTIQKLLEKELIVISGKATSPGKTLLYNTSPLFMDYFGIKNNTDLPQLKDFANNDNEIGEKVE